MRSAFGKPVVFDPGGRPRFPGRPGRRCLLPSLLASLLVGAGAGDLPPVLGAEPGVVPVFEDVTEQAGLTARHSFGDFELSNIVEGTGAGAIFFDYDGDGLMDIYLPNGSWTRDVNDARGRSLRGQLRNHLYRNNGDGTFTDVTLQAGVADPDHFAFGVSAADFNDNGHIDLYVLNYGPNVLFRNNGDGTFTDVSAESGLDDPRWSLAAPWFDANNNGLMDVYVANYLEYDAGEFRAFFAAENYPGPLSYSGQPDALYRNNGDGTFTEITHEAGLYQPEGRAMSAAVADLSGNGYLDIYVANDAMENWFFINQGDGTFVEDALVHGLAFGEGGQGVSSMGPAVGEIVRDGRLDLYIPDMDYGCLLINRGDYFEDRTASSGLAVVSGQYTGWGGLLFDFDNDGYLDLFVSNGDAHFEFPEEDVLMRNDGTGNFVDVARYAGDYFREKYVGRGAAFGDFDNDGYLDLLIVNLNDQPRLLRNRGGTGNHWLKVMPLLPGGRSLAIGATVTVTAGDLEQVQPVTPVSGYLSQNDPRAHFGLGAAERAERVVVRWSDGSQTVRTDVAANQTLRVVQEP